MFALAQDAVEPTNQVVDLITEYGWLFVIGMLVLIVIGIVLSITDGGHGSKGHKPSGQEDVGDD